MPKNVGDLGKFNLPKALKSCPKSKKSPNLVTLVISNQIVLCDVMLQNRLLIDHKFYVITSFDNSYAKWTVGPIL